MIIEKVNNNICRIVDLKVGEMFVFNEKICVVSRKGLVDNTERTFYVVVDDRKESSCFGNTAVKKVNKITVEY